MTVMGSLSGIATIKRRPRSYKSRDGAYSVGGNNGFYLASFPRPYPLTRQQMRARDVARECGIRKGMSKADLQRVMVDCVGPRMSGRSTAR